MATILIFDHDACSRSENFKRLNCVFPEYNIICFDKYRSICEYITIPENEVDLILSNVINDVCTGAKFSAFVTEIVRYENLPIVFNTNRWKEYSALENEQEDMVLREKPLYIEKVLTNDGLIKIQELMNAWKIYNIKMLNTVMKNGV